MDKLERYLEQVCRSMGGPRALRQHVRQELREHLLDAVAQHKAEGATDEVALDRALEEFGKPDEVRTELEATHGQRMLAVVIDKAIEWKELTMKAKWLWTTWAYLALVLVITMEALFIAFNVVFIVPKYHKLMHDGLIDRGVMEDQGARWMVDFLNTLSYVAGKHAIWLVFVPILAWAIFEWRVRSDNKAFMRLSALGTAAVALMVIVALTAGSLVVIFCVGVPATGRLVRPFAVEQISQIDQTLDALEQAAAKKDWESMPEQAEKMKQALHNLTNLSPIIPALVRRNEPPTQEQLRAHVQAASDDLLKAQQAIRERNADGLDAALRSFRTSYNPVRDAAKRPPAR
jgi:hypothetical protein